jgi:hypothetical protein
MAPLRRSLTVFRQPEKLAKHTIQGGKNEEGNEEGQVGIGFGFGCIIGSRE